MKRIVNTQIGLFLAGLLLITSCAEEFKQVPSATGNSITAVASTNTDLNILVAALTKTGLANTFANNNSGAFTVFAPTDAAFVAYFNFLGVPSATADEVAILSWINSTLSTTTTPSLATLSSVLLYHVVSSNVPSSKVIGAQGFVTLSGTARLSVSKVGANVVLNANRAVQNSAANGAQSITLDINASNGVIHTIDRVLIPVATTNIWASNLLNFSVNYGVFPPAITVYGTVLRRVPPVAPSTTPGPINLSDATALAPTDATGTNYNLLSMAIARAELATVIIPIAQPFPDFTVFAPTDAAFIDFFKTQFNGGNPSVTNEATARDLINTLTPAALADIVKYHVVAGRVVSTDLTDNQVVTTALSGQTFTIGISGAVITLKDKNPSTDPTITSVNNLTNAGVLHQISNVLRSN
jgi:transforming growth factor-beta-induced protein